MFVTAPDYLISDIGQLSWFSSSAHFELEMSPKQIETV